MPGHRETEINKQASVAHTLKRKLVWKEERLRITLNSEEWKTAQYSSLRESPDFSFHYSSEWYICMYIYLYIRHNNKMNKQSFEQVKQ